MCEKIALQHFLKKGYQLCSQNTSLGGVELDLIFIKEEVYYIIEVKSYNSWRMQHPLSMKQKRRLMKTAHLLSDITQKSVRLWIAFVEGSKVCSYSLDS